VWLALFGGVSGFLLAIAGVRGLRVLLPPDTPRLAELAVDGRVLIACVVMTLMAAAVFAAAPCAVALRESVGGGLRRSRTVAAGASRTRGLLVSVEVALALVLVAGASLMARTMVALSHVDPGFEADNLLTLRLQPSGRTPEQATLYWDDVLERVRAIPGVVSAGTVLHLPMSGRQWLEAYQVEGRPVAEGQSPPRTAWQAVSPGYFETARIPLVRGRAFLEADRSGAMRVAVINEVLAEAAFPAEDPLGRRIMTGNATGSAWATIVGVVGAVRHDSLTAAPDPELYVPFSQTQVGANSLVVRTRSAPAGIAPAVRERIRAVDPIVPIAHVMTMQDLMGATTRRHRTVFVLLGAFAAIGTVLGMVGIYGVVAYGVRQRVREIGIRMALGARRGAVARLLVREGLGWAAAGIAVGVLAALALTRLMRGLVFGVSPTDPATFVVVSLLLAAVAVLASWLPARRAARIEPTDALRT
jgi:predicted permease